MKVAFSNVDNEKKFLPFHIFIHFFPFVARTRHAARDDVNQWRKQAEFYVGQEGGIGLQRLQAKTVKGNLLNTLRCLLSCNKHVCLPD